MAQNNDKTALRTLDPVGEPPDVLLRGQLVAEPEGLGEAAAALARVGEVPNDRPGGADVVLCVCGIKVNETFGWCWEGRVSVGGG